MRSTYSIAVNKLERILIKNGVNAKGQGYYIINAVDSDVEKEVNRLGMEDGIDEEFEFSSEQEIEGVSFTLYGTMIEDYLTPFPDESIELTRYYPQLDSCEVKDIDGNITSFDLGVTWK
ncbi:hypothetical protein I2750_18585 [Bacillus sp. PR5]|nr:hypothetical protein [Bacillus sp. PR5]